MGIPDTWGLYTISDRLAWEAGEVGDELYGEPDYDEDGFPIIVDEECK